MSEPYRDGWHSLDHIAEFFWPKVKKGPGCWEWTAYRSSIGYGMIGVGDGNGRTHAAHRVSYLLAHGHIPDGLKVLHKCDNRGCVNPDHLFLGTQADNVADMIAKGRHVAPSGEHNGFSKLTEEQVREIRVLAAAGDLYQREIGAKFGVAQCTVSKIVLGQSWIPRKEAA